MITAYDLENATARVLQRLNNLVVLPKIGTVAGQAVASVFYEELGLDMRGPINDVDIFVPNNLDPHERGVVHTLTWHDQPQSIPRNPTARTGQTFGEDGGHGYNHVKFICARSNVVILRTYKDGLRNFTLMRHASQKGDGHGLVVSQDIVDGFDLNLVQVGINLTHKQVVFTPNFLEFLNTQQLKVATCNTPTHTLIRLASKNFGGELLNINCDYEREKSLLTTYLQLMQQHRAMLSLNSTPVEDVGSKYAQTARRFSQHVPSLIPSPAHDTLLRFDCADMAQSAQFNDLDILFGSAHNKNFEAAINVAFIANFPKVFEIAENNKTTHIAQWEALKNAAAGNQTPARAIHTVQSVLRGQPLLYSHMNMPDNESVLFFHQQHCTQDPIKVDRIIEQYNMLNAMERLVLRRNRVRADGFDEFILKKEAHCAEYLNDGLHVLLEVGEEAHDREEMNVCFEAVLAALKNGMDEMYSVSPQDEKIYNGFVHSHFTHASVSFLKHYAPAEKMAKIQQLFDLMSQPFQIKSAQGLVSMAHANGVYDTAWWQNDFWFMESGFVDFLRTQPIGETEEQQEFFTHMLNHVSDTQLMEQKGAMLCNILKPHCYNIVRERVARMDKRWLVPGLLGNVCRPDTQLRRTFNEPILDQDLMTKLVLDLEMAQVSQMSGARRKM